MAKDYSAIFSSFLKNKNSLAVNTAVLSEVINRAFRIEYENYLIQQGIDRKNCSFKQYRNCAEGIATQKLIYEIIVQKILKPFKVLDKNFSNQDIANLLVLDSLDFTDKIIVSICKEHNLILVTNDSDFSVSDVDILSTHKKLC